MPESNVTPQRNKKWGLACAAILGLLINGAASGQEEFCSEPVTPYCAGPDSQYETMLQINRCKDDLRNYEEELDDYETCIEESLERMRSEIEEARENLKEAEEEL